MCCISDLKIKHLLILNSHYIPCNGVPLFILSFIRLPHILLDINFTIQQLVNFGCCGCWVTGNWSRTLTWTFLAPSVPMLVMAGLCSFFTCCFVIFFRTRYRRLEAEEQATYGTKQSNGSTPTEHAQSVEKWASSEGRDERERQRELWVYFGDLRFVGKIVCF